MGSSAFYSEACLATPSQGASTSLLTLAARPADLASPVQGREAVLGCPISEIVQSSLLLCYSGSVGQLSFRFVVD